MYIKGLVNTNDQSNAYMCEMMSKGSKEALTVLIVTHVTHVERVKRLHYVHNIDTFNAMSKGSKDYVMLKQETYAFLLIIFLIFNQFSIPKSFGKLRLTPFQPYHPMLCMLKGSKVILTFNSFNMLQHT